MNNLMNTDSPLPPAPFTQADMLRLSQYNAALSQSQKEVDDGILSQDEGMALAQGILQMRAPLLQRQQEAAQWAKQMKMQETMELSAQLQGIQHADAVYRSKGLRDRVSVITDPMTGRSAHLYESSPNQWEQIEFGGAGGEGESGEASIDYFPLADATGKEPELESDLAPAGESGSRPPTDKAAPAGKAALTPPSDEDTLRWLASLPDKPGAPGYQTQEGMDLATQGRPRPLDPLYDPQFNGQFEHPIFGPYMYAWRERWLSWRERAFPQPKRMQAGDDDVLHFADANTLSSAYQRAAETYAPSKPQPPMGPTSPQELASYRTRLHNWQSSVNALTRTIIANEIGARRRDAGVGGAAQQKAAAEAQKKQEDYDKRYQARLDGLVDSILKDSPNMKEGDAVTKAQARMDATGWKKPGAAGKPSGETGAQVKGNLAQPPAASKGLDDMTSIAVTAANAKDFEGATAAYQLRELMAQNPGGFESLSPELKQKAVMLRQRIARHMKGYKPPEVKPKPSGLTEEEWRKILLTQPLGGT